MIKDDSIDEMLAGFDGFGDESDVPAVDPNEETFNAAEKVGVPVEAEPDDLSIAEAQKQANLEAEQQADGKKLNGWHQIESITDAPVNGNRNKNFHMRINQYEFDVWSELAKRDPDGASVAYIVRKAMREFAKVNGVF